MAYRPLLPRDRQHRERPGAGSPTKAKRQSVSSACNNCRRKKVKCNGKRPACGYCEQTDYQCQYAVPEGLTARQALIQRNEVLTESNRVLYAVFERLRHEGSTAADLLRHIREAPSTDAAIRSISDALLLLPSSNSGTVPPTEQSIDATSYRPLLRQTFFHSLKASKGFGFREASNAFSWPNIESLGVNDGLVVNVATESLPISKWTRISSDDVHLTHLFNLFWTWDNTISRVMDRDIFMADLKHVANPGQDYSSGVGEFCSSFMVNALLAMASMYSSDERDFAVPGDATTRGRAFADEAHRLFEREKSYSRPSLALLWVHESNIGDGILGLRLLDELYSFYSDFAFGSPEMPTDSVYSPISPEATRWKAKSHLAWGFYGVVAKTALKFSRLMMISTPAIARCSGDTGSSPFGSQISPGSWFAYPVSVEAHDSCYGNVFQAECDLAKIVEELLIFREAQNVKYASPDYMEGIGNLFQKLMIWKQSLPDCIRPPNSELPSVLMLHITHGAAILKLLEGLPNVPGGISGQSLETLRITHATFIMSQVWLFRSQYALGREYWAIPGCFAAATGVLEYLSAGAVQADTFTLACQALAEMGVLLPLASSFLNAIQQLVLLHKITLPGCGSKYLAAPQSQQGRAYTSAIRISTTFRDEESDAIDGDEGRRQLDLTFYDLLDNRDVAEMEPIRRALDS